MRSPMVTMVKSSDSELPVLDFSRARNFRRAYAVRKLGIWERDRKWPNDIGMRFTFSKAFPNLRE